MAALNLPVVDTDVLIAHLRGVTAARDWLSAQRQIGRLSISVVTIAELTGGMRSPERTAVAALLDTFRVEPVSEAIARRAGCLQREYRRSHIGIGLGDYLIAATALELGTMPATLNIKHFPMFPELKSPFVLPR